MRNQVLAMSLALFVPIGAMGLLDKAAQNNRSVLVDGVSIDILNTLLANEFVLLMQTLSYHWNIVGPEFHDYHLLFNEQYKLIFEKIDDIAERVRAVGGIALGSLEAVLQHASIKESSEVPTPRSMVERLLHNHEVVIGELRVGIEKTGENNRDMGTSNFLTELLEKHEKIAWMLRSLAAPDRQASVDTEKQNLKEVISNLITECLHEEKI